MKDYSLDQFQAERFILNYKIKGNEIIVNFAKKNKKDKYVIPYTIENEKKLLQKMKQQVLDSNHFFITRMKSYEEAVDTIIPYSLFGLLLFGILSIIGWGEVFTFCFFSIPTVISSLTFLYSIYWKIDNNKKLDDIKKNQFFLKNEELFNFKQNTKSTNNIILGTKYKLDKRTNQIDLNLNSIHKLKYKELKLILENIKFEENLNFNYNNSMDIVSNANCKNKVLTKKVK